MTTKERLLIVIAAVWLLLLFFIITSWMKAPRPTLKTISKVEVLVAANPIEANKALSAKDMRWQEIAADKLQSEDIKHEPQAMENYLGRKVLINLSANQIIKKNYFAPAQAPRMAQLISPGKYAITIELPKSNSENLFIVPGDKVDVFLTRSITNDPTHATTEYLSRMLLTDVRVLAVNKTMTQEMPRITTTTSQQGIQAPEAKTLTLEVNSAQVELLTLGLSTGTLSFGLRTESESSSYHESSAISSKSLTLPSPQPIIEYHGAKVIEKRT
jgi:pilus assembly protein CpaB